MATKKTAKAPAKKKGSAAPVVAAGAAALAAAGAAAAAGYYFYGTKHAKQHRQAAAKWAKGMQKDVQKGVKTLKKIDAKAVAKIVDDAASAYQGVRGVAADDVRAAAKELKTNWKLLGREMKPSAQVTKTVKKVVKTAKSTVKKVERVAKKTAKRR